jgi:hypothetical protein
MVWTIVISVLGMGGFVVNALRADRVSAQRAVIWKDRRPPPWPFSVVFGPRSAGQIRRDVFFGIALLVVGWGSVLLLHTR